MLKSKNTNIFGIIYFITYFILKFVFCFLERKGVINDKQIVFVIIDGLLIIYITIIITYYNVTKIKPVIITVTIYISECNYDLMKESPFYKFYNKSCNCLLISTENFKKSSYEKTVESFANYIMDNTELIGNLVQHNFDMIKIHIYLKQNASKNGFYINSQLIMLAEKLHADIMFQ